MAHQSLCTVRAARCRYRCCAPADVPCMLPAGGVRAAKHFSQSGTKCRVYCVMIASRLESWMVTQRQSWRRSLVSWDSQQSFYSQPGRSHLRMSWRSLVRTPCVVRCSRSFSPRRATRQTYRGQCCRVRTGAFDLRYGTVVAIQPAALRCP